MKHTLLLLAMIITMMFNVSAQETNHENENTEKTTHPHNSALAELLINKEKVGLKFLADFRYFHKEHSKFGFVTISSFEAHQDTTFFVMFGACHKFHIKNSVFETALCVGLEDPFHLKTGAIVDFLSTDFEAFGTVEYGGRTGWFYKANAVYFPIRYFGVGLETQRHVASGLMLIARPIPAILISVTGGVLFNEEHHNVQSGGDIRLMVRF